MLNELLIIERGGRQAGIEMAQRHPDLKEVRRVPTLLVSLDFKGHVASVRPVPPEVTPWTLRDGQHNSFPFVQPKEPLWAVPAKDERRGQVLDKQHESRRAALLDLARDARFNGEGFGDWPGRGLLDRLRERREQLAMLENTDAAVVLAAIDRFRRVCDRQAGGDPHSLLQEIAKKLIDTLKRTSGDDWLDVTVAVAIDGSGAFVFDAEGEWQSLLHTKTIVLVSEALCAYDARDSDEGSSKTGICALTGQLARLVSSKFPQPNLPQLGQTYLFARNKDTEASHRYDRYSAAAMPVAQDMAIRLAAAFDALTAPERHEVTWRGIPGEAPKQTDLLLAFVEEVPDAPAAAAMGNDGEEDFSQEESLNSVPGACESVAKADSIAAFEKRTQRVVDAVRAKVGADFRKTPVRLAVFRKVDPANRKIVFAGTPTVGDLYDAATRWAAGERNVPPWITLPVLHKGERKPRPMSPPHVAPLGTISFSKQLFIRGGAEKQEIVGLTAAEAFAFFLDLPAGQANPEQRRIHRVLRVVLARRAALLSGTSHALRCGFEAAKGFDRREALRAVTVLGLILHKLGQPKEEYMKDTGFQLGQLLTAADVVHAGYCADVRGGDLPPSLLGNQVFAMAQTTPAKALAVLCRRWKPYDGWVNKATRERDRADHLAASKNDEDRQRGWDIKKALRHAREMKPLAGELAQALPGCTVDDAFRAKLLLGYIAGLPPAPQKDSQSTNSEE